MADSSEQVFTPSSNKKSFSMSNKNIVLMILGIILLVVGIVIAVIGLQEPQVTTKKAEEVVTCEIPHMPPGEIAPGCFPYDAPNCAAPGDGQCKPKGNPCSESTCWECRTGDGLRVIQYEDGEWVPCGGEPTPTVVTNTDVCLPPKQCLPPDRCRPETTTHTTQGCTNGEICCLPLEAVTPTEKLVPTLTPTIQPTTTSIPVTPSPTTRVTSAPTSTPRPQVTTSSVIPTSTPRPTSAPTTVAKTTIPDSGIVETAILFFALGGLILLFGFIL